MAPSAITPTFSSLDPLATKGSHNSDVEDKDSVAAICYGPVKLSGIILDYLLTTCKASQILMTAYST